MREPATPLVPSHLLALDHQHREIVLSVRGTLGVHDLVNCTHFGPEPFLSGYAHKGMARSAIALAADMQVRISSCTESSTLPSLIAILLVMVMALVSWIELYAAGER
jgi:hypothetical protein